MVKKTEFYLQSGRFKEKTFEDINAKTEYLEIDAGQSMNSASIENITD